MLGNTRPREGAQKTTVREAIFGKTFSKAADETTSISSQMPSGSCTAAMSNRLTKGKEKWIRNIYQRK
jgi:hypothetical protein